MSELAYLYKNKNELSGLYVKCLVTGPICLYPDWQKPEADEFRMEGQWDTGAAQTLISRDIVELLSLNPTGKSVELCGISGAYRSDTYLIDLYLSEDLVFRNVMVAEMGHNIGSDVLIGLDVILQSDFILQPKDDDLLLKFRYPSEGDKPFSIKPVKTI